MYGNDDNAADLLTLFSWLNIFLRDRTITICTCKSMNWTRNRSMSTIGLVELAQSVASQSNTVPSFFIFTF